MINKDSSRILTVEDHENSEAKLAIPKHRKTNLHQYQSNNISLQDSGDSHQHQEDPIECYCSSFQGFLDRDVSAETTIANHEPIDGKAQW